jgi:hypothetical protein
MTETNETFTNDVEAEEIHDTEWEKILHESAESSLNQNMPLDLKLDALMAEIRTLKARIIALENCLEKNQLSDSSVSSASADTLNSNQKTMRSGMIFPWMSTLPYHLARRRNLNLREHKTFPFVPDIKLIR